MRHLTRALLGGVATTVLALSLPVLSLPVLSLPALAATAPYQHVLLISVDGMHGIDLQNFIGDPAHATSTLAALSRRGIVYQNAYTTAPSDSFPGMIAQVTGATPLTADVFYDDSYDAAISRPARTVTASPAPRPTGPRRWTRASPRSPRAARSASR